MKYNSKDNENDEKKHQIIKMQELFEVYNKSTKNEEKINIPEKSKSFCGEENILIYNASKNDSFQSCKNIIKINRNINNNTNFIEGVILFIDDSQSRFSEFIINNYECQFYFDSKVQNELLDLLHFTPKYFEFPIFYFFKGFYNADSKVTTITLKDYRSYKIKTQNNQLLSRLKDCANNTKDLLIYAENYKIIQNKFKVNYQKDGWKLYDPYCEFLRQGIEFSATKFCFSERNAEYKLCETYPNILVLPIIFDNDELDKIVGSRMKNRFPVLTYFYHKKKIEIENNFPNNEIEIKSYLYRSAQVKTGGIIFKSKNLEVEYINTIMNMENNNEGFIIFDCRPQLNAKANTFKGAGTEDIKKYINCKKIIFGIIENIHCVRQSLKSALLKAYYGKESIVKGKVAFNINNLNMKNFLTKFEDTKWLEYISSLLLGSITVSNYLMKGVNVLVHCSDGWDRTSQICSLVQIILDPFFRTIEGFAILIEKEWVSFGHQFAMRNGCDFRKEKKKERSPIFIQFLHAVYQMLLQYPSAFEFNSNLLLFLCREIYSNKYGTFLFNCEKDLNLHKAKETTVSIWSDVILEKNKYINYIYKELKEPINIKGELQYLSIWNDYFFQYDKLGRVKDNDIFVDKGQYISNIIEEKRESIMELLKVIKDNKLEDKIKDNKLYKLYKDELH